MSSLTPEQQRAVDVEGNVLLIAGAGTGKTRTLVERCLTRVCRQHQPVGLNEVLLVTFTEAAAAEMRQRLRDALDLRLAANPQEAWLSDQRSQLDTARISTLHSFCLELVREHFYELGLDPQVSVLADDQSRLLAHRTLDDLLRQH